MSETIVLPEGTLYLVGRDHWERLHEQLRLPAWQRKGNMREWYFRRAGRVCVVNARYVRRESEAHNA